MNLPDELAATLRDRADGVEAPPAFALRALRRGRALRRRRRIAAVTTPAVAVALAVTVTSLVAGGDRATDVPPPAVTPEPTRSAAPFPGPTGVGPTGVAPTGVTPTGVSPTGPPVNPAPTRRPPAGAEPPRPYALQPAQAGGGGSVHVGSRDLALPDGFVVSQLSRARGGVLVVLQSLGGYAVRFAGEDGTLRTIPELDGRAIVSPDGTRVVGSATFGGSRMALFDIASGERLGVVPGNRTPLAFLDGGRRILFLPLADGPQRLGVWDVAGYTTGTVPIEVAPGTVIRVSPDGRTVLLAEDERLRAVDLEGRGLWTRPGRYWEGPAIAFSPDGSRIALVEEAGDLTVVATADGDEVTTTTGFAFEAVGVEWLDAGRVVLSARDPVDFRYDDQQLICRVGGTGRRCEPYELPQAVLPST
jgi:hypothetical protein